MDILNILALATPFQIGIDYDVGLGIVEAMQLYCPGAEAFQSDPPGADTIQLSGE